MKFRSKSYSRWVVAYIYCCLLKVSWISIFAFRLAASLRVPKLGWRVLVMWWGRTNCALQLCSLKSKCCVLLRQSQSWTHQAMRRNHAQCFLESLGMNSTDLELFVSYGYRCTGLEGPLSHSTGRPVSRLLAADLFDFLYSALHHPSQPFFLKSSILTLGVCLT